MSFIMSVCVCVRECVVLNVHYVCRVYKKSFSLIKRNKIMELFSENQLSLFCVHYWFPLKWKSLWIEKEIIITNMRPRHKHFIMNKWFDWFFDSSMLSYSEFHGFRSQVSRRLFLSQLWPLLRPASFFDAAEAVAKIGLSLKSNHHKEI